jgi:hypothetical protein
LGGLHHEYAFVARSPDSVVAEDSLSVHLDLTDEKAHRVLHRIGVLLDEMAAVALAHHACRLRRFGRLASTPHQFPGRTPKTAEKDCVGYRVPGKALLLSAFWIA